MWSCNNAATHKAKEMYTVSLYGTIKSKVINLIIQADHDSNGSVVFQKGGKANYFSPQEHDSIVALYM